MDRPSDLEARIGYQFRSRALLQQALTHRSYSSVHNERLEFLGDSVLGCIMSEALYARFPELTEGPLTRMRAVLVCEQALSETAQDLGIEASIRLGEGEPGFRLRVERVVDLGNHRHVTGQIGTAWVDVRVGAGQTAPTPGTIVPAMATTFVVLPP